MSNDLERFLATYRRVAGLSPGEAEKDVGVADAIAVAKGKGLVAVKRLVEPPGVSKDPFGSVQLTHCRTVHRSTRRSSRNFALCFSFRIGVRTASLREAVYHVAVDLATMAPLVGFTGFAGLHYENFDYRPRLSPELIQRAFTRAQVELGRCMEPMQEEELARLTVQHRTAATRVKAYFHQLQKEVLEAERRVQRRIDSTRAMIASATTRELKEKRQKRLVQLEAELETVRDRNDFTLLEYRKRMEGELTKEEDRCGLETDVTLTSVVVLEYDTSVETYLLVGRHAHAELERAHSPFARPEPPRCACCGQEAGTLALDAAGHLVCPSCARVCTLCGSVRSERCPHGRPSKLLAQPCPRCGL